ITGAIVQRQSFGGWKKSVMGPGAKAGGPNYVAQFGTWEDGKLHPVDVDITPNITKALQGLTDRAASKLGEDNIAWLWRAAELDQVAWQSEFSREHDRTGLIAEANIFRYRPLLDVLRIRVTPDYELRNVVRHKHAALITVDEIRMSAPADIAAELSDAGIAAISQDTAEYAADVAHEESARILTLDEVEPEVYEAAVKTNTVIL